MRSSGSVIGGAINFATNYSTSSVGGIAPSTYLIFIGFGKSTAKSRGYARGCKSLTKTQYRMLWLHLGFPPLPHQTRAAPQWRKNRYAGKDQLEG